MRNVCALIVSASTLALTGGSVPADTAAAKVGGAEVQLGQTSTTASPGQFGPPAWLPLRRSADGQPFIVGCVKTNCTITGRPYHNYWAIDIQDHANAPGAPVFAAGRGQVVAVDATRSACGPPGTPPNYVWVDHGLGVASVYVHMVTVSVSVGDWVDQSTPIGTVGAVGYTFPCPWFHLHFELRGPQGGTDPGPLLACHDSVLVSYPSTLGFSAWDDVPPYRFGLWSDGSECALPGAPGGVTARARDRSAEVRFSAPTSDGGLSIASYTVTASPGGVQAEAPGSPILVGGLSNGSRYTFTVAATNLAGTGPRSAPSSVITPAAPVRCIVPNLTQKRLAAARVALVRAHCTVGLITSRSSSSVGRGRVLGQKPAPGARLPDRSRVNLVVSRGSKP